MYSSSINYSKSEKYSLRIRSLKRLSSWECVSDQPIKVPKHSFSSQVNDLPHLQAPDAIHCDLPELMEYGDTCQKALQNICDESCSLPIKSSVLEPLDSRWFIPASGGHISGLEKLSCTISDHDKPTGHMETTITTAEVISKTSQRTSHHANISRTFPMVHIFHNMRSLASNDSGCQKCAAGQSGHIQHIGQWRVMDSI